jgi:hypothetical protein
MSVNESYIDRLSTFRNAIFVDGWSSLPSQKLVLVVNGKRIEAQRAPCERRDLIHKYGEQARHWGFSATFVATLDDALHASEGRIFISQAGGDVLASGMGRPAGDAEIRTHTALLDTFFQAFRTAERRNVLEIGSRARSGISRRNLFPDSNYIGLDVLDGENVDIVGDAHELSSLIHGPIDFVFSVSVFEHLMMPWKVAAELSRVMAPGGLVCIQTHQTWPVHDAPWDFWRFSKDSWPALFNAATGFEVLETAYFEPVNIASVYEMGNAATRFGDQRGYGGVSVLARALGPSRVSWDVSLAEILETHYPA